MKIILRTLLIFLLITLWNKNIAAQNYFQQQVNYKIDVKLNDSLHTLHAFETIEYINHSRDALDVIYFHLWPNAYQKNSALDKQLLADGDSKLHFAKEKNKGFIDSLNFTSQGHKLRWEYDEKYRDICIVYLPKPLLPNENIEISTPFFVKIPSAKISRLGHIGQFYAITQWYPKPAVYDVDGWHQMPYLNQGEFYSEFGSFDVSITLPENYVVGATGDLQTQSEIDFLNEKSSLGLAETTLKKQEGKLLNAFPVSSKKYKTIRYSQQNVHDFAWFADKRFTVKKSEVKLPYSGNAVTTWAMFTPQNAKSWKRATEYINDAIFYYSKWNGDYPYKHCTAIDGTISAGGGMEYPNITIINPTTDSLQMDIVITHEVGHNWFYGILGSNERLHPWMDEGINSFNEMRYVKTKYPNLNLPRMIVPSKTSQNIIGLKKLPGSYFNFYSYWITAMYNADQPIELPSEDFTSTNYGQIVYQKTAASFNLLYSYLGEQMFDSCMHNYFNQWKFKHPQPADIRAVFETTTGKNLAWFFDDVIGTKGKVIVKKAHSSFDESAGQYKLKLKNKGNIDTPIEITFISKDSTYTKWLEPFKKDTTIKFGANIEKVVLDKSYAGMNMLGANTIVKYTDIEGQFIEKIESLELKFFPHLSKPKQKNLYLLPCVGYNTNTYLQAGIFLTNGFFPLKKLDWHLVAMASTYGFPTIIGSLNYNWHPNIIFKRITIGSSIKSFTPSDYSSASYSTIYYGTNSANKFIAKGIIKAEFIFNNKSSSKYNGRISILGTAIRDNFQYFSPGKIANFFLDVNLNNSYKTYLSSHQLNFNFQQIFNAIPDNLPWFIIVERNVNKSVLKFNTEFKSKYKIYRGINFRTRFFAGIQYFRSTSNYYRYTRYGYSYTGNNDYTYDNTYLNRRNESFQTYISDGGVRNRFESYIRNANNMLAFNSSIDLIGNGLLSVYYDVSYSNSKFKIGKWQASNSNIVDPVVYIASGIRIALIPDYVEFFLPFYLYETIDGKRAFKDTWKNVNILVNLTKLNPFDAARKAYD